MKLLMNAFEEYERKWEEELNKLPGRIETVEQALDAIERIALNGYKQIKTAEDVSLRPVSPHSASTVLLTSSAVYASGFRPHVRGRHSSVPTGLGLGPPPSQPSARVGGQHRNWAGV